MFLRSIATAVPENTYTQKHCAEIARESPAVQALNRRSRLMVRAILTGDSGIDTRYFGVPDIDRLFDYSPDELNATFRHAAPAVSGQALAKALADAGIKPQELDALFVCTCTGYLCPGVSSYVAESLDMRPDTYLQDLVGLGCGAAIPTMRAAANFLSAHPDATVACIAVEVCSAAFYLDDDPGVIISACLFGDGAAATVWSAKREDALLECRDFSTLHLPAQRDKLRFEQRHGKLRNLLDASVPDVASQAVAQLLEREAARSGARKIERVIAHPGGKDVVDALEAAIPGYNLDPSRRVLRNFGNMSSPSVLFALEDVLKEDGPNGNDWWLVAFGAGFSAHGCRVGSA